MFPTFCARSGHFRCKRAQPDQNTFANTGVARGFAVRCRAEFNCCGPSSRPLGLPMRAFPRENARNGTANQWNEAFLVTFSSTKKSLASSESEEEYRRSKVLRCADEARGGTLGTASPTVFSTTRPRVNGARPYGKLREEYRGKRFFAALRMTE